MNSSKQKQQTSLELTFRVIVLGIILATVLAASNTYLALKIGILTSASIPAAILSMGILRFFKNATILENNLVQTAASAGEAVAGGIVYTIPGLIIIHYWQGFSYWENFFIALLGGTLGVLFSIPIRRTLVHDEALRFPEGRAIAHVLQMNPQEKSQSFKWMLQGGLLGAVIEFLQTGLHVAASSTQYWFRVSQTIIGAGIGFSATMVGAGFLMGIRLGLSLLVGACITWIIGIPIASTHFGSTLPVDHAVMQLWGEHLRYVGIGGMLMGGLWTLLCFLKPFSQSLSATFRNFSFGETKQVVPRTEQDLPLASILISLLMCFIGLYFLFQNLFVLHLFSASSSWQYLFLALCLGFILLIGFASATICGYFSGMVGVTATPGSAIAIACVLLSTLLVRVLLESQPFIAIASAQLQHACAIVIIMTSVIMGASAIANDNIQDLKVGQLIGATPWKQQLMLFLGTVIASAIVPVVMQLLFSVYGIGDVMPHPGMDPNQTLAAPPAAMMAMLAQAVFTHHLPVTMLLLGAAIVLFFIITQRKINLSVLGIGIGMYLPLTTSTPLILGSVFAYLFNRYKKRSAATVQSGTLKACGMVAGAALMDVVLAVPMVMSGNSDVLAIMPSALSGLAVILGFVSVVMLGRVLLRDK